MLNQETSLGGHVIIGRRVAGRSINSSSDIHGGLLGDIGDILIVKRGAASHNVGHDGITSNVQGSDAAIQEPVNGHNKLETIWNSSSSKDSVVSCNHKDQSGGWNWGSTSRSNGGKDNQQDVRSGVGRDSVQDGEPADMVKMKQNQVREWQRTQTLVPFLHNTHMQAHGK